MGKINIQPILKGALIELRPMAEADFESLYQAASDPLIWEQHPQSNRYERHIFKKFFDEGMKSGGALVIIDKTSGAIIGSSRYYNFHEADSRICIGYTFLARKYWGGEFNRELKSLMVNHAFAFVDTIAFEIGDKNFRSRRAIEKIGAQFVGKQTLDEESHVIYELYKSQWN